MGRVYNLRRAAAVAFCGYAGTAMKIAVISRYFPSSAEPWQGRSAFQTVRLLAQSDDVQVFFPNAAYPPLLKPRSRIFNRVDPAYKVDGVPVKYYNYPALPLLSRPFSGAQVARMLLPDVRRFAPDVLLGVFLYPDAYTALKIGKALGVPVVAMTIGSDINRIGDRFSEKHTRTLLREMDFLVAVSDDLRRKAVAMGAAPQKTRALLNGSDLSVFHPGDRSKARERLYIEEDTEAVVYIGRQDVKKGLRELVEAAAALRRSRPRLHVYMVGEGPDRPVIEAAIAGCDAGAYIHALPACKFDEVAVWMTAADVVTLPSYMEGCPNVVIEALACGRPVVSTRVGGIPELVTDEVGRLVEPRDAKALEQALDEVLDRSWDAAAISARGSRSWGDVAAELRGVFEQAIAARQPGKRESALV